MLTPPYTGNAELDAFLYDIHLGGIEGSGTGSGFVVDSVTGTIKDDQGNVVGYLYQFIHIKYADSNTGLNISNSPTNRSFYGVHNSTNGTEDTVNPSDFTWYEVPFGFSTTRFLYYQVLGGRQIKFTVETAPPDYRWLVDSGAAVNLDILVPTKTISSNELLDAAVTELKIANAAVTSAKTNIAAISAATGNLVANSVGTSSNLRSTNSTRSNL